MAEDFLATLAKEAEKGAVNVPPNNNVGTKPPVASTNNNDYLSQLANEAQSQVKQPLKEGVLEGQNAAIVKATKRGVADVMDTGANAIGYLDQKIDLVKLLFFY